MVIKFTFEFNFLFIFTVLDLILGIIGAVFTFLIFIIEYLDIGVLHYIINKEKYSKK